MGQENSKSPRWDQLRELENLIALVLDTNDGNLNAILRDSEDFSPTNMAGALQNVNAEAQRAWCLWDNIHRRFRDLRKELGQEFGEICSDDLDE